MAFTTKSQRNINIHGPMRANLQYDSARRLSVNNELHNDSHVLSHREYKASPSNAPFGTSEKREVGGPSVKQFIPGNHLQYHFI